MRPSCIDWRGLSSATALCAGEVVYKEGYVEAPKPEGYVEGYVEGCVEGRVEGCAGVDFLKVREAVVAKLATAWPALLGLLPDLRSETLKPFNPTEPVLPGVWSPEHRVVRAGLRVLDSRRVGILPVAMLVNHSCDPNCEQHTVYSDATQFSASLVALRDVAAGEELTICYAPPEQVEDKFDFVCGCPVCRPDRFNLRDPQNPRAPGVRVDLQTALDMLGPEGGSRRYGKSVDGRVFKMKDTWCSACSAGYGDKPPPPNKLMWCSACKNAFYCNKVCQKADWPKHKLVCKDLAVKLREGRAAFKGQEKGHGKGKGKGASGEA
jgi:hypothetical protein